MGGTFRFPPVEPNTWRPLDERGRLDWLEAVRSRFFDEARHVVPSRIPGRTVVLDGDVVDNRLGFYCAFGEAVNGPGGYFGGKMESFDDCMFGGFGLEPPWTVIWRRSAESARILEASALLAYLDAECRGPLDAEGLAWREETRKAALSGTRTLFDEIVETIRSVPLRSSGKVAATLVLE